MENSFGFEVKENSIQEFAEKFIVDPTRPVDYGRRTEPVNPYYLLGKDKLYVRKDILNHLSEIQPLQKIRFTLSDSSRNMNHTLLNTYEYSIKDYDTLLFELTLEKFKVENV